MNTTTAAIEADVTIATIRTWCRNGVIAATKQAGRWIIDAASLARRITIGRRRRTRMATYHVTQTTTPYGSTAYKTGRTDGTPDFWADCTFMNPQHAAFFVEVMEGLPAGYRLTRETYPARSMQSGHYWKLAGSTAGDPSEPRTTWDDGQELPDANPCKSVAEHLIRQATMHAAGAPERIAKQAEKDAIEAAESAVREAREAQLAELRRTRGELATPRQVDYILQLLAKRERTGEGGGFFYGPTDRAGIEEMSKADASSYITSLKGDY